jgi:hypothetical protein
VHKEESIDENERKIDDAEDDESDEGFDVQRAHFNQTVQALYTIKSCGLKMPQFSAISH